MTVVKESAPADDGDRDGLQFAQLYRRFLSYTVSQTDFSKDLLQPWTGNP